MKLSHNNIICYPCYIDSSMKAFEGRRISKEKSVENPNVFELELAAKDLGFEVVTEEDKKHPRDFFRSGRINVSFYSDDKKPLNSEIKKKKIFLIRLSERIKYNRENNILPEKMKNNSNQKQNKGKKK